MKLQYSLSAEDHLQFQLFTASKTKRIQNQRRNVWLALCAMFLICTIGEFLRTDYRPLAYFLLTFSLITFFFYPRFQSYHYKKHYRRFVNDTYKNKIDNPTEVLFGEQEIETKGIAGESKIYFSELEEINEIADYIFVKMKSGICLVIPKRQIRTLGALTGLLKQIANERNAPYHIELDWKWK